MDFASKISILGKDINIKDAFKDFVTPQMYGATADGITDDTQALKDMFNSGNKNYFFPRGTYIINDSFEFNDGSISIIGNGATIKNANDSDGGISTFIFRAVTKDIKNVTIQGITFDGNKQYRDNAGVNGIFIDLIATAQHTCRYFYISDCVFINNHGVAIYLEGLHDNNYKALKHLYNITIRDSYFYNVFQGISQSSVYETRIDNCHIEKTNSECLTIDNNSYRSYVTNCTFVNHNGGVGAIGTDDGRQCVIANNTFDLGVGKPSSADANGICFNGNTGTCQWYQVVGNNFTGYYGSGIKIYGTEDRAFIGCGNSTFTSNTFLLNAFDVWIGNCDFGCVFNNNAYNSKVFVLNGNKANILKYATIDFPIVLELSNYIAPNVIIDSDPNSNLAIVDGYNVTLFLNFNYTGSRAVDNVILNLPDCLIPNRNTFDHSAIGCDNGLISGVFIDRDSKKLKIGIDSTGYINDGGYAYLSTNYVRSAFRQTS